MSSCQREPLGLTYTPVLLEAPAGCGVCLQRPWKWTHCDCVRVCWLRGPEEPHPCWDLLRTQQTGTSSPCPTNPQRTAWISELTQKRVPRLEISLKAFPERPPRSILTWLRGLKAPGEEGCRMGPAAWQPSFALMPTRGGILNISAPRGPPGGG